MAENTVPSGFFRFGMAYASDQQTVRLRAIKAVSEIQSLNDMCATLRIWFAGDNHPVSIGYGSLSAAEHDRRELMAALHYDNARENDRG